MQGLAIAHMTSGELPADIRQVDPHGVHADPELTRRFTPAMACCAFA